MDDTLLSPRAPKELQRIDGFSDDGAVCSRADRVQVSAGATGQTHKGTAMYIGGGLILLILIIIVIVLLLR